MASGAKVMVNSYIHHCQIQIGDLSMTSDLRVTTLGSYDVVLGMDWVCAHNAKMDCKQKKVECFDDCGTPMMISGVQR